MSDLNPLDEARDPQTTAERLAQLAADYPETRVTIVSHPSVYPDLLSWLAEYGGEEVRAAVERASSVQQVASAQALPPVIVPEVAVPEVAAGTGLPPFPLKKMLISSGAVLVVIALVIAAAVVLPGVFGGKKIRIAEFKSAPHVNTWSVGNPFEASRGTGDNLSVRGTTVGQDFALVTWELGSYSYDERSGENHETKSKMMLLNTRNGKVKWQTDSDSGLYDEIVAGSMMNGRALVSSRDYHSNEEVLRLYNLDDGSVLAETSVIEFIGAPESLGGDFIGSVDGNVNRYSIRTLQPVWQKSIGDEGRIALGQETLIIDSNVYSLSDGSKRSWRASEDSYYAVFEGVFVSQNYINGDSVLSRVDERSGQKMWSMAMPEAYPVPTGLGAILLVDEDRGTIALMSLTDGKVVWTVDAVPSESSGAFGASPESGVIILPLGHDRSFATAVDANTGQELYKVRVSNDGDWWRQIIAMTDKTLYLSGGKYAELIAMDVRTGEPKWSVPAIMSNWYEFELWGGNFVAVQSSGSTDGDEEFARIIGIG